MPGRNRLRHEVNRLEEQFGKLLDAHGGEEKLEDLGRYGDRPVEFIREVLDGKPIGPQEDIARAVLEHPRVTVQAANAVGKDWMASRLALWWVYARKGLVLLTGPTLRQIRDVLMNEIRSAWGQAEDLPGELYESALRVDREAKAEIRAFTSSDTSKLTGHHAGSMLCIITESQGIDDHVWEAMFANLASEESRLLALGNPLSPSGRFYQICRSDHWHRIQIGASDHPNVQQGREVVPGAITTRFVEDMANNFGRESPVFRSRVLGRFPDEGEEGLFRRSWLERAAQKWEAEQKHPDPDRREIEPVVAVDPARFGADSTAVAVRRGPVIEEIITWSRKDLMETCGKVIRVLNRVGVERHVAGRGRGEVVVDAVGVGSGVVDRLDEEGYAVSGYKSSRRPRDKERFHSSRAEAYWELRERLEDGRVALPRDEELFDELLATRWRASSAGKVRLESKSDLRGRIGRSPDKADAVVMSLYSHGRRRVPSPSEVGIITWGTK